MSLLIAAERALSAIEMTDRVFQFQPQMIGGRDVLIQVETFDLLFDDPPGHRINVES
ncbi:MAG: hypothetical protein SCM96_04960 [Acidobacteriota bacterium]|nr:hypothetical protein [Acidobacteriota bacterium]